MFVKCPTSDNTYLPCKILRIPERYGDSYTVQHTNGDIHQYGHWELFDYDLSSSSFPNGKDNTLPSWIQHECKATLFLPTMEQPKHGTLLQSGEKWLFQSGKRASSKIVELLDFHSVARDMIKQFVLFPGHKRFRKILHFRSIIQLKASVAKHVSASGLTNLLPPPSVESHSKNEPYRQNNMVLRIP